MTWPPKIPWWVTPIAILVAVLAVVWSLNRGRGLSRELARVREEHVLELAGLNVAHQVERTALMDDLIGEASQNAKLTEELAKIQAAAPGAKPIAVVTGHTAWKPVGPAAATAPPIPPAAGAPSSPVPASSCPPCRLWVGDEVRVKASGAGMLTDLGNVAVAGVASVWRRQPGVNGEELLHEEKLVLDVKIPEHAAGPGWGFGPLAGFVAGPGGGGWFVGATAATPPVRLLFGVEGALVAGGGGGPNGVAAGWVGALFR